MKTTSIAPIVASALLALSGIVAGCTSDAIANRIQEKSTVFAALPPEQQKDIRQGTIQPGFTADMVYMALGKPSQVKVKDTAQGKVGLWIYNNFYPEGYQAADSVAADGSEAASAGTTKPTGSEAEKTVAPSSMLKSAPAAGAVASDEPVEQSYITNKQTIYSTTAVDRPDSKMHQANADTFSNRSAAMDPLNVPDMPSASLYVIFYEGRVVQMKLGHE